MASSSTRAAIALARRSGRTCRAARNPQLHHLPQTPTGLLSKTTATYPGTTELFHTSSRSSSSSRLPSINSVPLPPSLRARVDAFLQHRNQGTTSDADSQTSHQTLVARIVSIRKHAKVTFLSVSDGSLASSVLLQVVLPAELHTEVHRLAKEQGLSSLGHASLVQIEGHFVSRSRVKAEERNSIESIEFKAEKCKVLASSDDDMLSSTQYLSTEKNPTNSNNNSSSRQFPHLRSLLPSAAATMRFRSRLEMALSTRFAERDFVRTTPPIMTASDCEGAGEVFRVVDESIESNPPSGGALETSNKSNIPPAYLTVSTQLHLEALMLGLSRVFTFTPAFRAEHSDTNRHLREFWMCEAELATYGKDADEELEMLMGFLEDLIKTAAREAFADAPGRMAEQSEITADSSVTTSVSDVSARGTATLDILFLWGIETSRKKPQENSDSRTAQLKNQQNFTNLLSILSPSTKWPRITYTEALEILHKQHASTTSSSSSATTTTTTTPFVRPPPTWGEGLGSEHEKWLSEHHFKSPLFVTNYPAESKPFYMRIGYEEDTSSSSSSSSSSAQGEGGGERRQIVKNFDLLVPHVGELAGGSLRENSPSVLLERLKSLRLLSAKEEEEAGGGEDAIPPTHPLHWYLVELRNSSIQPHGGFGIGVERLVAWLARRDSVRECIPFPRVGRKVRF